MMRAPPRLPVVLFLATLALAPSALVRAEPPAPAATAPATPPAPAASAEAQEVRIVVQGSYQPATSTVVAGKPIRVVFLKKDWSGCTKEVVFPTLGIRRTLKTNEEVVIELPAQPAGEVPFQCGMNMVKGSLTVTAAK